MVDPAVLLIIVLCLCTIMFLVWITRDHIGIWMRAWGDARVAIFNAQTRLIDADTRRIQAETEATKTSLLH